MTLLMIYAAVVMLGFGVVANRAVARRLVNARDDMAADEKALRQAGRDTVETERTVAAAERRLEEMGARVEQARAAAEAAEQALDRVRRAPVERYYVFDRLEPRPGTIWSVPVQLSADPVLGVTRAVAAWGGERTYLVAAANPREVLDRVTQRFPRSAGYAVGPVAPCHLFTVPGRGDRKAAAEAPVPARKDG